MKIVTLARLNSALADVIRDFEHIGIWNERVRSVDVYLVPAAVLAYGWKYNGADGHIEIPAVNWARLQLLLFGRSLDYGLRDVLRHEYGHAIADLYPRLTRSRAFVSAFGGGYDRERPVREYDPEIHVSAYAATQPAEDFAECFMLYVKHRGRLPAALHTPSIRKRWGFIRGMAFTA